MKRLLVIGLLLSFQLDCTSPNFRKNQTKSKSKQRAQHNTYCKDRKLIEQEEAVSLKKNDLSILSTIKNYTQDQKKGTQLGVIFLSCGLVEGYFGYQALKQGILSENIASMVCGASILAVACADCLRGQTVIIDAYHHKDWHNIMRSKIK
ncbi:MAG: hypothetical protein Q8Q60_02680 [Candidatus Chromulinivorax sp.]|nr:hypothetical protein [Candidatus Chromulinivorax sp.]